MKYEKALDDLLLQIKERGSFTSSETREFVSKHPFLSVLAGTITDHLKGKGYITPANAMAGASWMLTLEGHKFIDDGGFVAQRRKENLNSLLMWAGAVFAFLAFMASVVQIMQSAK